MNYDVLDQLKERQSVFDGAPHTAAVVKRHGCEGGGGLVRNTAGHNTICNMTGNWKGNFKVLYATGSDSK